METHKKVRETPEHQGDLASRMVFINRMDFLRAAARDVGLHDRYPTATYVDCEKGSIEWVYLSEAGPLEFGVSPREHEETLNRMKSNPDRYLEIPGLTHEDHHVILRTFLGSRWTEDEEQRKAVDMEYFGSIGGWRKAVGDETFHAYCGFRDDLVSSKWERFLSDRGITVRWR